MQKCKIDDRGRLRLPSCLSSCQYKAYKLDFDLFNSIIMLVPAVSDSVHHSHWHF